MRDGIYFGYILVGEVDLLVVEGGRILEEGREGYFSLGAHLLVIIKLTYNRWHKSTIITITSNL